MTIASPILMWYDSRMLSRPPTIKDIAAHLGLDPSSVSRALNGHGGVSEETRELIKRTADELGYVINISARMMQQKQSKLVGLLVPDIKNDFHSTMAAILAEHCRGLSFQMVLSNTDDDPEVEESQVRALIEARAAGIVITATPNPTAKTVQYLRTVPTVQLLRHVSGIKGDVVCMEDAAGIGAAVEHLLSLGHRRIAYVGTRDDISVGAERLRGFTETHRRAALKPDKALIVLGQPRQSFASDGVERILRRRNPPTALIVGSTEMTVGALQAVTRLNLSIPGDLSFVGYGNPEWYSLLSPPLTTVNLPVENMARSAVAKLFRRINRDVSSRTDKDNMQAELVIRASTAMV